MAERAAFLRELWIMVEFARSGQRRSFTGRKRPGGEKPELGITRRNRRARGESRGELRIRLQSRRGPMLYWVVLLIVLAIISGILGFTGVLHAGVAVPQVLFAIFLILLVASLVFGAVRRRRL